MLPILPTAKNLELIARQAVEGFIIGLHKSPFHGFSVEFAEHRQYNSGDELRHIDWRVFGKSEKFFVKKFEEETNLRCTILLDTSSSMHYPQEPSKLSKLQYGCYLAASLTQLLKRQLDASALALFDERLYFRSECRSSSTHYRFLMSELTRLFDSTGLQKQSNISGAIHELADQIRRRSLVIVISDMVESSAEGEQLFDALQHLLHNKHEVILVQVMDKKTEIDFDFENRPFEFVDMETGAHTRLRPAQLKEQYVAAVQAFNKTLADKCFAANISRLQADLSTTPNELLHAFLLKRNKMQ